MTMGPVILIPAGERRCVLDILSSSLPEVARFDAEAQDGGGAAGTVEVVRRVWFSPSTTVLALQPQNRIAKSWLDTRFQIWVTPDSACRITVRSRHLRAGVLVRILLAVAALGLVAGLLGFIMTGR